MPLTRDGARPAPPLRFAELAVGQVFSATEAYGEADMNRFAELSGDFSLIHTDAVVARRYGFPDRMMYGFLLLSLLSRIVGANFADAVCGAVAVDFTRPVFPSEKVTVSAEISQIQPALRSALLKIAMRREAEVVVRGKLTVVFLNNEERGDKN